MNPIKSIKRLKSRYDTACLAAFTAITTSSIGSLATAQTLPELEVAGVTDEANPIKGGMALIYYGLYYFLIIVGIAAVGLAAYLVINEARKPDKGDENRWARVFITVLGGLFIIVVAWWLVDFGINIIPEEYRGF